MVDENMMQLVTQAVDLFRKLDEEHKDIFFNAISGFRKEKRAEYGAGVGENSLYTKTKQHNGQGFTIVPTRSSDSKENDVVVATLSEVSSGDKTSNHVAHLKEEYSVHERAMQYIFCFHWAEFQKLKRVSKEVRYETRGGAESLTIISNSKVQEKEFRETTEAFVEFYKKLHSNMHQIDFRLPGKKLESLFYAAAISETQRRFSVIVSQSDELPSKCFVYGKEESIEQAMQFLRKRLDDVEIGLTKEGNKKWRKVLSHKILDKVKILVYQGDITKEDTDAIVNPANERLQHGAGVAKHILEKGGEAIKDQSDKIMSSRQGVPLKPGKVEATTNGHLPCKFIVHAVAPRWKVGNESQCRKQLRTACLNSFILAMQNGATSIAIPAISSGVFGMPTDTCAEILFGAAEDFSKRNPGVLREIRFVNIDEPTVQAFQKEMRKRFPDCVESRRSDSLSSTADGKEGRCKSIDDSKSRDVITDREEGSLAAENTDNNDQASKGNEKDKQTTDCCICLETMKDPEVLSKCKHVFCKQCINKAFQDKKVCPVCSTVYGVMTGNQPDGTMTSSKQHSSLPGYPRVGSIMIQYSFKSGTQGTNHPNPGQRYKGTTRTAYLPDNEEGNKVLRLLRKAFDQRLTFTIGTSVTSGRSNQVTWNDIHHKTNISGGETNFGYPDPGYLKRVQEELAAKGIE